MYHSTTHLAHGIDITDIEAQYDENAKALMADKQVLASNGVQGATSGIKKQVV